MFANPVWNDLNPTTIASVEMSYRYLNVLWMEDFLKRKYSFQFDFDLFSNMKACP